MLISFSNDPQVYKIENPRSNVYFGCSVYQTVNVAKASQTLYINDAFVFEMSSYG